MKWFKNLLVSKFISLCLLCLPGLVFADIFHADTDGDGTTDTITTEPNWVNIFHPSTGQTSPYFMGPTPYSVVKIVNTDGRPGEEVLLIQQNFLVVIDDARKQQRNYNLGDFFDIHFTADTDGLPGEEIVTSVSGGKIRIIDDARITQRDYDINVLTPGWITTTTVFDHADTNGLAGDEVVLWRNDNQVLVIEDAGSRLRSYNIGVLFQFAGLADTDGKAGSEIVITRNDNVVGIIHDATGAIINHNMGQLFQISGIADTNGVGGKEVVVSRNDFVLLFIDDSTGVVRQYPVNGPFNVEAIQDLDQAPGAEVCYLTLATSPNTYFVIIDRLGTKTLSSIQTGCALPRVSTPTAPSNLVAKFVKTILFFNYIQVSWQPSTDDVGVASYLVEYCAGAGCTNFTQRTETTSTSTITTIGLLQRATRWRVRAKDVEGNLSPYSNVYDLAF